MNEIRLPNRKWICLVFGGWKWWCRVALRFLLFFVLKYFTEFANTIILNFCALHTLCSFANHANMFCRRHCVTVRCCPVQHFYFAFYSLSLIVQSCYRKVLHNTKGDNCVLKSIDWWACVAFIIFIYSHITLNHLNISYKEGVSERIIVKSLGNI